MSEESKRHDTVEELFASARKRRNPQFSEQVDQIMGAADFYRECAAFAEAYPSHESRVTRNQARRDLEMIVTTLLGMRLV